MFPFGAAAQFIKEVKAYGMPQRSRQDASMVGRREGEGRTEGRIKKGREGSKERKNDEREIGSG